jgi:hypothetical protein
VNGLGTDFDDGAHRLFDFEVRSLHSGFAALISDLFLALELLKQLEQAKFAIHGGGKNRITDIV